MRHISLKRGEKLVIKIAPRRIGGFTSTEWNPDEGRLETKLAVDRLFEFTVEIDPELLRHLFEKAAHHPKKTATLGHGAVVVRAAKCDE